MDLMLRVLKNNVSGGFQNDIANVYNIEDLTNYKINDVDWMLIIRNTPYQTLKDAGLFFNSGIKDVTNNVESQIENIRRCRYSVDWSLMIAEKTQADLLGWIDINYSNLIMKDNV